MGKLMLVAGDVNCAFSKHFMRLRHNLRGRYKDSNSIVPRNVGTGGSNGIGRACCEEFAGAGFNLIVVDKDSIGTDLLNMAPDVMVEIICYNFANLGTEEHYKQLEQQLSSKCKDVAILINNSTKRSSLTHHDATFYVLRTLYLPDTLFHVFSKELTKVFDRPS